MITFTAPVKCLSFSVFGPDLESIDQKRIELVLGIDVLRVFDIQIGNVIDKMMEPGGGMLDSCRVCIYYISAKVFAIVFPCKTTIEQRGILYETSHPCTQIWVAGDRLKDLQI